MATLTNSQFQAITRYHFGVGPKPWVGHPHISVSDIGRKQFDYVTGWWKQFAAWMAWQDGGKKGPRPKVWRVVPLFAWQLRKSILAKRPHDPPPPPPPPPLPPVPAGAEHLQNVSVGAWAPMEALAWPGCKIWFSADPDPSIRRHVTASNAAQCRSQGHEVGVWYVPDQVEHSHAVNCANTLGTNIIAADVETLGRFNRSVENGDKYGIANLSALFEDPRANAMIASGQYVVMNEFYWGQSRNRRPDNHYLPVASLCIMTYDGCSDSQEGDCFHPSLVEDYRPAGYYWQTMSVYQQGFHEWSALPKIGG
jgi:hypothetical protein